MFSSSDKPLRSMEALTRLRGIEDQQARSRLNSKRIEIVRLEQELEGLKRRRHAVLSRGRPNQLRERLLLDALMKIAIDRGRRLEALNLQSAVLLAEYREARGRREAAESLRDRRRDERQTRLQRRADAVSSDLAAARLLGEERDGEEEACGE